MLTLNNDCLASVTAVPDLFLEQYMPAANGEFVKVYLYLLKLVKDHQQDSTLSSMADFFSCTENDIVRALKYWESEKLIALTYTADQKLSGITLLEPFADTGHRESSASVDTFTGSGNSASVSGNTDPGVPSSVSLLTGSENLSKTKRSVSFSISQSSI